MVPEQRPMDAVAWRTRRGCGVYAARICLSVVGGGQHLLPRGARQKSVGVHDERRRVATDAHDLRHTPQGMRQSRTVCACGPRTRRRSDAPRCVPYGDGVDLWRQAVTTVLPGGNVGDWRKLKSDHPDPADLAFTPGHTDPLMLATDGGVHLTKDQGKNWTLTGSNVGGFVALQMGEVTGRPVGGSPHLDLYYGTQDNQIRGSSDGGATWSGAQGGEGAFLQVDRANPAMVDGRAPARTCGNCRLFDAPPHLGWDDPEVFAMRRMATPVIPTHTLRSNSSATTFCSRSSCRRTLNTG